MRELVPIHHLYGGAFYGGDKSLRMEQGGELRRAVTFLCIKTVGF